LALTETKCNKFQNISLFIHDTSGYYIFVYSVLGQVCWPWMTPSTISSLVHMQYRVSWNKRFGCPGKWSNSF